MKPSAKLVRNILGASFAAAVLVSWSGCSWLQIAWGALTYPTTAAGEAANVVAWNDFAYVTRGEQGFEILDLATRKSLGTVSPPESGESADDLAVADGILFVLDARPPGHLLAYSLEDPSTPVLRSPPMTVETGPFSGVSAAGGRVVVSGGTSRLQLRAYGPDGRIGDDTVYADAGRGQPDVLLSPDGELAFVSTHTYGPHFALTILGLSSSPLQIKTLGQIPIDTYGFTLGGAKPANFPLEGALEKNVFFAAFAGGLAAVDVSDPKTPRLLSVLETPVKGVSVDVRENVAAVVGSFPKPLLVLVDASDPARPQEIRAIPLPEGSLATGVALAPPRVLIAAHSRGVLALNSNTGSWEGFSSLEAKEK